MAYINKPKKNTGYKKNHNKVTAQKYIYNTPKWKSLRLFKLQTNPLCEECLSKDKIEPAVEVHHIQPFMEGTTIEQIKWLGFDYNNLQSLCNECHQKKHKSIYESAS